MTSIPGTCLCVSAVLPLVDECLVALPVTHPLRRNWIVFKGHWLGNTGLVLLKSKYADTEHIKLLWIFLVFRGWSLA